jgi:hypothetical protein
MTQWGLDATGQIGYFSMRQKQYLVLTKEAFVKVRKCQGGSSLFGRSIWGLADNVYLSARQRERRDRPHHPFTRTHKSRLPPPAPPSPPIQTHNTHKTQRNATQEFFGSFEFAHRWRDLGVLFAFIFVCNVAFYLALKYRKLESR